jgi:hypothetical protein
MIVSFIVLAVVIIAALIAKLNDYDNQEAFEIGFIIVGVIISLISIITLFIEFIKYIVRVSL